MIPRTFFFFMAMLTEAVMGTLYNNRVARKVALAKPVRRTISGKEMLYDGKR
jgi:hypothetical protein